MVVRFCDLMVNFVENSIISSGRVNIINSVDVCLSLRYLIVSSWFRLVNGLIGMFIGKLLF